ncbi:hypothetical protein [Noviherbaspirillum aridicola]|uniref:Uncharacterized protein n=1 Tax=Noviherbaspirillum aridicola TaxID=2849687 RepID=A0ABQ4Q6W6_9BURK|nr:hypothetical protein [Noviherbaspirillum aridicola]GIZ52781.1 hypothetical protein NCCP691_27950 [Noviherbaspirillum aridicola]
MYLVYLRDAGGAIVGSVEHLSRREDAERSFARLVNDTSYDGFALRAVLVEDRQPIAVHRFDRPEDRAQSWRDRLDQIPFSSLH